MENHNDEILVIVKRPGKTLEEKYIKNTLSNFEEILESYDYSTYDMSFSNFLVFYSHGNSVKPNLNLFGITLFGPLIFTGVTPQGEICSLMHADIPAIKKYIKSNAI